jgi:hypothetical protein
MNDLDRAQEAIEDIVQKKSEGLSDCKCGENEWVWIDNDDRGFPVFQCDSCNEIAFLEV